MSAPAARTCSGSIALTVAAVPTGMKAGVRILPRGVSISPRRAAPSVARMEKRNKSGLSAKFVELDDRVVVFGFLLRHLEGGAQLDLLLAQIRLPPTVFLVLVDGAEVHAAVGHQRERIALAVILGPAREAVHVEVAGGLAQVVEQQIEAQRVFVLVRDGLGEDADVFHGAPLRQRPSP